MDFTKEQIVSAMRNAGIVPLFTHEDPDTALNMVQAAYRGGMRVFEFTNRKSNSFDVFCHLIKNRNQFPDLAMGIGTVMDGPTTKKFIDAGADFIISPILRIEMGEVCKQYNKHWIPGCATISEIAIAKDHGAEVIKIFPGSVLGPGFISSVLSVIPDLKLMVTGGVEPTESSLSAWFKSGAMAVGLGSQLFTKEILEKKDWTQLQQKVSDALTIAQRLRQTKQ
jgi:2-dehydro-3-deoxyphosphogluconate aldolase/(4S)-4-hydroxy-2-oxoglutarate aldolase